MHTDTSALTRLKHVVQAMTRLSQEKHDEAAVLKQAAPLMRGLVARDDWLPEVLAQPDPRFYRQYLLHADPLGRFSIVSFVWGPGQQTPVHDHTVWGIIAMLRGAEYSQPYQYSGVGALIPSGGEHRLDPGDIEMVSPTLGDVHRVRNAFADKVSVSIHLYGGNIGEIRRHVFDPSTGQAIHIRLFQCDGAQPVGAGPLKTRPVLPFRRG